MKNLLMLLVALVIVNCEEVPKDYVILSGKIKNAHESNILKIYQGKTYEKEITLNDDGTFKDTLKIKEGEYTFKHGEQYGAIYLKNGYISSFETDYEDFDNTLLFKGDGADANTFSIASTRLMQDAFSEDLFTNGTKADLRKAVIDYKRRFDSLKKSYISLDSLQLAKAENAMSQNIKIYSDFVSNTIAMREELPKGSPSPTFENYENFKGGSTSLEDLKGKYVYIDIWATWCGPCKAEIPSLKKIEAQYHGKNIEFVSISIDDLKDYSLWKKMVEEKSLGGIQLYADNAWTSDFVKAYRINGIPRFILIDPNGNIISPDAPRPSSPKLVELFKTLKI